MLNELNCKSSAQNNSYFQEQAWKINVLNINKIDYNLVFILWSEFLDLYQCVSVFFSFHTVIATLLFAFSLSCYSFPLNNVHEMGLLFNTNTHTRNLIQLQQLHFVYAPHLWYEQSNFDSPLEWYTHLTFLSALRRMAWQKTWYSSHTRCIIQHTLILSQNESYSIQNAFQSEKTSCSTNLFAK